MGTLYNKIANQNLERLAALSDGLFSVAMTLLILDIHVPPVDGIHSDYDLWRALLPLKPRLFMWLMSFLTLGIFWNAQQTQFNHFTRSDRNLSWIHIAFLVTVSMVPFSTVLLAQFITFRLALLVYWANIAAMGAVLLWSWWYARRAGLIKADTPHEVVKALYRRVAVAQTLYAVGLILCLINTTWSITFILLVQLNYAIAPRHRMLLWLG
jgi:uncharacterized membrane protein